MRTVRPSDGDHSNALSLTLGFDLVPLGNSVRRKSRADHGRSYWFSWNPVGIQVWKFQKAADFSPVANARRNENRFNGFPAPIQFRLAARWIGVVAALLLLAFSASAQQPVTNNVRFLAVDIFVDSKGKPLAAYQLEFAITNDHAKIVGIEGGEHPAFREPPHYDPKAMQQERVIVAAFSTEPANTLPTGKTRVATIQLQVIGTTTPAFEPKLQTAADAQGSKISVETTSEERNTR